MNPQIPLEARQTVLDFVTAGTSFTAYEVTLEVRRRLGAGVDVPHNIVNGIVQTMFANGEIISYDRQPDPQIQAATKPFRYYQIGGAVVAPFVAPTAPAISRSNLPAALRFGAPLDAILRNYGIAARDFQRAVGAGDQAFAVWLPTAQAPTFRLRCYGTGLSQSEVEARFGFDPNSYIEADLIWKTALAYADEFRVFSNLGGQQQQFLVALDPTIHARVTKEAERATGEPDSLEIEIEIAPNDAAQLSARAPQIYRYLKVAPRLYLGRDTLAIAPAKLLLEGEGWKLTDQNTPLAIVDEFAYLIGSISELSGIGVEFEMDAGAVEISARREGLNLTSRTRAALYSVFRKFCDDLIRAFNERIESAPNLWEARALFGDFKRQNSGPFDNFLRLTAGKIFWRGIAIENENFTLPANLSGVQIRLYRPASRGDKTVTSTKVQTIAAHPKNLIFINDTGKSATSRIAELYRTAPFESAYVLTFESDAARANFTRELHFETVPTRLISELPQPAPRPRGARVASRHAFDANLHSPHAPTNPLVAAFANGDGGSDADFERLKTWARECDFDGQNWADWKRLYKAIEAQLWPPMGRFRWDKTEADFAAAPLPSARQLEILGVLMGRLDENAPSRGALARPANAAPSLAQRAANVVGSLLGRAPTPQYNGPSAETVAYLKRRAERLLIFLRDTKNLSAERRAALAPLVCGLMQRENCSDLTRTLPLRLRLDKSEVLARHPDFIARVWEGGSLIETLPLTILKWAYQWLEAHDISPRVTVAQLRRFADYPDVDWTLKLAPAVLQSQQTWPLDWDLAHFARALQGTLSAAPSSEWRNHQFRQRRADVLNLLARFPQLPLDQNWLRASLGEVEGEFTLDWLAPQLQGWARNGEFALIETMSEGLQNRFNRALVAAQPNGLARAQWQQLMESPELVQMLAPALSQMPLSDEVAAYLWALPAEKRGPVLAALGDNLALTPLIERHAQSLDWPFAAPLSSAQWELFTGTVAQTHASGMGAAQWQQLAALPFESGHQRLPLGAGFWEFLFPQTDRARWLERVGNERAAADFARQNAATFEALLDADASGLEQLGDAWLDAHQKALPLDGELILKLAQSALSDWQARALRVLAGTPLQLSVALRLMESGLPILENVARPFFEGESPDWSARVLALADSPNLAARRLALELLRNFPVRWTPELLRDLAQHDDKGVQAFVAAQLQDAPAAIEKSAAIEAFDTAILNARGRSRRAKTEVQTRLNDAEGGIEPLLEAARNGAPRDRAWALQQLVKASLNGVAVEGLEVEGAFARATDS